MKLSVILVSGALVVSGVAAALAHGGATGIVKERMDAMSALGKAIKSLSAMMRGETAYDAAAVRKNAEVLQSHSGEALTKLFPEGSIKGPSEAKPEIWSNWQEFADISGQLELFATALGEAADNGLSEPGAGGGMMGQSGMMGQGSMMGEGTMMGDPSHMQNPELLAQMPVQGLFAMTAQTCSSCHTKFRIEKK
ncbi:cytochrome c [Roseibium album]|uniref:c-type cytochrome n=1 Tax=Roseibium album TaxID=311410 RepID=UPI000CF06CD1|nr:cytochrome c556 [Labrenzia sp. EL_142]